MCPYIEYLYLTEAIHEDIHIAKQLNTTIDCQTRNVSGKI